MPSGETSEATPNGLRSIGGTRKANCPKCRHEWEPRTGQPGRCPKCFAYMKPAIDYTGHFIEALKVPMSENFDLLDGFFIDCECGNFTVVGYLDSEALVDKLYEEHVLEGLKFEGSLLNDLYRHYIHFERTRGRYPKDTRQFNEDLKRKAVTVFGRPVRRITKFSVVWVYDFVIKPSIVKFVLDEANAPAAAKFE